MGKHLLSKQASVHFENGNPGCMWGILHILDHHHWHQVKKVMIPHKSHGWGRHARDKRTAILYNRLVSEEQDFNDTEAETFLVKQQSKKANTTSKRSRNAQAKAVQTEDSSKEETCKCGISDSYDGSKLEQVSSFDHFEVAKCRSCGGAVRSADDLMRNQASREHAVPQKKDDKITDGSKKLKAMEGNNPIKDISGNTIESADVLEILKLNKDLLARILQDPNDDIIDFHGKKPSNTKARLAKSGSFPVATSSRMRIVGTSTLKHKQSEIWVFPKGEKSDGIQSKNMLGIASNLGEDNSSTVMPAPLLNGGASRGKAIVKKQKRGVFSWGHSEGLNHQGWNQMVLHRLKVIKKKIKHALMEFKKDSDIQTHTEASQPEISPHCSREELLQGLKETMVDDFGDKDTSLCETEASDHSPSKHKLLSMRRTSSLNESLDKYTQLFERSFGKDTIWRSSKSKSLNLANGEKVQISRHAPKLSERNLSLPNIDSSYFLRFESTLCDSDSYRLELPVRISKNRHIHDGGDNLFLRKSVDVSINADEPLDATTDAEVHFIKDDRSDKNEVASTSSDSAVVKNENQIAETGDTSENNIRPEVIFTGSPGRELALTHPISSLEAEPRTANYATEGTEFAASCNSTGVLNASVDLPARTVSDSSVQCSCSPINIEGLEGTNKNHKSHFLNFDEEIMVDSSFKYVKGVLESSGVLSGNKHPRTWHAVDQPLNPSLLKDLEATLPQEAECSGEEIGDQFDYLLLFDLVNEVLLDINERSFTYFPRPFFDQATYRTSKGNHLLNQVWTRINSYMNLKPDLDQTLDDVVARDWSKGNGNWMNLQWETDYVALELEDLIWEELLDEVIY